MILICYLFTEDFEELESMSDSSDDEMIGNITEESADVAGPSNAKKIKRSPQNFVTTKLVSVLDKCKISDRDAVRIIIATAEALKHDVNDLTISASTIRRRRKELRAEIGHTIRETFDGKEVTAVTVHWDGKILPSLTGTEHIDRLPVVISFNGSEQLLGIPAISSGTGKQQAIAVHDMLKEWDLVDKVEALCCDTTASNMGRFQGACVFLEGILDKDLLYLPCRHHIFEIILRSVFEQKMEKSSGPVVQIFKKFRETWNKINKNNFKTGIDDQHVKGMIGDTSVMVKFASEQLRIKQPRDDYKELLELVIVFLGGTVPGFSFKIPGAFHHARWMAKAIYCLKIFLFRNEFGMTQCDENGIRDICIFVTTLYIKVWIQAPVAAEAPREDLSFLKSLYSYSITDENVSREALRKFCNHLWYLSPEAVGLAFFDPKIPYESKKRMVAALDLPNDSEIKKLSILPHNLSQYLDKNIDYFISQRTRNFFKRFSIPTDFLCKDPEEWNNDPSYILGLNIVSTLHVVNDCSERAVKLMEDYNNILSRNENEKQLIMQVVADYRKQYPDATKSNLTQTD